MQPVATPGGRNPSGRRSSSGAADARLGGWDPGPAATTDARLAGYYRHGPKNVASWSSDCSMRKGNITPFDYPVIAAGNRRAPRRIPDLLRWSMPTPLQLGPAHGEIGGVVMAQGPVPGRSRCTAGGSPSGLDAAALPVEIAASAVSSSRTRTSVRIWSSSRPTGLRWRKPTRAPPFSPARRSISYGGNALSRSLAVGGLAVAADNRLRGRPDYGVGNGLDGLSQWAVVRPEDPLAEGPQGQVAQRRG